MTSRWIQNVRLSVIHTLSLCLCIAGQKFKRRKGNNSCTMKVFYVMLKRIVEIYIIYIEEWNMSNCIKEQKICQILYILFIIWLNYTPVNGVLHCKLRFIFMFEKKISLTSLFESEFDFQSWVLHHKFLTREHFNTKSHYSNHDDVLLRTLWKNIIFKRSNISY